MRFKLKNKISLKKILAGMAGVVFLILILLAQHATSVQAHIVAVTVTPCEIEFGNVFPEEQLKSHFDVELAKSCNYDPGTVKYSVVQKIKPKHGAVPPQGWQGTISDYCQTAAGQIDQTRCYLNLCPFLKKVSDSPSDTETTSTLGGTDKKDKWTINFLVPDIFGSVGQENEGGVVSQGGDYGCDISIEVKDEQPQGKGKISGINFEDWDGDGSNYEWQWEKLLAGWTIYLDANNNGQLDSGEQSTNTNWLGQYSFDNLPAGTYHVREVLKGGWMQITPKSGSHDINLGVNQTVSGKNFGNFKLGKISGLKFEDKNGNGRKDHNEEGLKNWTIQLKKPDGSTITATTDKDGKYYFGNLGPGKYKVSEVQQTGWKQMTKDPGTITINSGDEDDDNNFGNRRK